jgi:hypothetical protein
VSGLSVLRKFLRAPGPRRRLALEAVWHLACARLLTLAPPRLYTRVLGTLDGPADAVEQPSAALAEEVGRVVARVAARMPFRARCLQQSIAVRRMLLRRGLKASVYLGVSRNRDDRATPELGRAAHAWVEAGGRIVSGADELDRFVVVARFA